MNDETQSARDELERRKSAVRRIEGSLTLLAGNLDIPRDVPLPPGDQEAMEKYREKLNLELPEARWLVAEAEAEYDRAQKRSKMEKTQSPEDVNREHHKKLEAAAKAAQKEKRESHESAAVAEAKLAEAVGRAYNSSAANSRANGRIVQHFQDLLSFQRREAMRADDAYDEAVSACGEHAARYPELTSPSHPGTK